MSMTLYANAIAQARDLSSPKSVRQAAINMAREIEDAKGYPRANLTKPLRK